MGSGENLLNRDGVRKSDGSSILEHKVGFGTWEVLVTFGDVSAIDQVGVFAEGVFQGAADYAAGHYANYIFQTTVSDGGLTLEFVDQGGSNSTWSITRLILTRQPGPALRHCGGYFGFSSIVSHDADHPSTIPSNTDRLTKHRSTPEKLPVKQLLPEKTELPGRQELDGDFFDQISVVSTNDQGKLEGRFLGRKLNEHFRLLDEVFERLHVSP